ncbi:MAG: electron transfer flavoprotein subunit beta, partial [Elusimicrobiota bacterium]
MALNIVVCVKSIPSTVNVGVDASGRPKIVGVPTIMNPFDEFAVEAAVRLKEGVPGSTVTALSVGSDAAAEILREAIARGADGGALVTGAEFEGGDSYATSRALSAALKKLHAEKPVSLVIFGKNTSDAGAGVVGT